MAPSRGPRPAQPADAPVHDDDAALRAALTQVVLADLRAGRSPLTPPATAALRILESRPAGAHGGPLGAPLGAPLGGPLGGPLGAPLGAPLGGQGPEPASHARRRVGAGVGAVA